jgi:hypothetical protein
MFFLFLLALDIILSLVELPKMIRKNMVREMIAFSLILALGTALAALKSFGVTPPNPSDFLKWVYSPVRDLMQQVVS